MASFKIIIDHTKVAANLTDFPVYIDLANFPQDFWDTVTNGGGDIRCYDVNDSELAREVVSCDTTLKSGELHVKANLSSTVPTILKINIDGTSADYDPTDSYGSQAVWTDYSTVLHLGSQTIQDSAGFLPDKTVPNIIDSAPTGGSVYFDNNPISYGNVLLVMNGTLSAWVKAKPMTPSGSGVWIGKAGIYGIATAGTPSTIQGVQWPNYSPWVYMDDTGILAETEVWHRVVAVYGNNANYTYVDGVLMASHSSYTYTNVGRPFMIGGDVSGSGTKPARGRWVGGASLTPLSRDAEWIATEYNNQSDPTAFYTVENIVQAPIPYSDGFAYIYENVGYSAPNSGQGYGYSYENVGYSAPNSGDGYGYSYENVGYNAPNSGVGYGYSYENVTIYVIDNDSMLPPIIS